MPNAVTGQRAEKPPAHRDPGPKRVQSRAAEGATALARVHASAGNAAVGSLLRGEVEARDRLETIRGELQRPGHELDVDTHAHMEAELGRELPPVRVHDDAGAARAAKAANATAFTHGSEIVLGAGVAPLSSTEGRRVLAHELVHVIQQAQASPRSLGLVPPGARAEQQALSGAASAAPSGPSGVARLVEKDLSRLSDAELAAEYEMVRRYLADQPPGPDYDAGAAYILEIEAAVRARALTSSSSVPASGPSPGAQGVNEAGRSVPRDRGSARSPTAPGPAGSPEGTRDAEDLLKKRLEVMLVSELASAMGAPPGSRMLTAMASGMVEELSRHGTSAVLTLLARGLTMGPGDHLELSYGLIVGVGEGIVSPVTDLFGLLVFAERINNFANELMISASNVGGEARP